jgi:hypothetical protein
MKIIDYTGFPSNVLVEDLNGFRDIIRFRFMSEDNGEALWYGAVPEGGCYALVNANDEYQFQPFTLSTEIVTNILQFKHKYGTTNTNTTTCTRK